jgi:uncharacterized membrane protein
LSKNKQKRDLREIVAILVVLGFPILSLVAVMVLLSRLGWISLLDILLTVVGATVVDFAMFISTIRDLPRFFEKSKEVSEA